MNGMNAFRSSGNVLDAYFVDWMCNVMGGERLARWECKTSELKDTKIYPGIFHSVYIYIFLRS
jgi:hypothetical protein